MATRTTTSSLDRTIVTRFPDIVLAGCVLGFVFLLVELYLFDHFREGTQIVGFSATALGILLSALGFVRARAVRGVVMTLLGLLTLVGAFGVLEHREAREKDAVRFAQRQAQLQQGRTTNTTTQTPNGQAGQAQGGTPGEPGPGGNGPRVFRSNIPVLSPLALSALSALTLLSMVARGGDARDRLN